MQNLEIPFLGDTVSGECRLVEDHSSDKGYSCVTGRWEVVKLPLCVDPTCDPDAGEQSTLTCHETFGQNLFEQMNKKWRTFCYFNMFPHAGRKFHLIHVRVFIILLRRYDSSPLLLSVQRQREK